MCRSSARTPNPIRARGESRVEDGEGPEGAHDLGRTGQRDAERHREPEPAFAEGWNKRATLYWLLGEYEASVADIARTLALEPRHFGALSGLSMIREAQSRPVEALEALEKVLELHPHLAHLQERIDHLTRQLGEAI